MKLTEGIRTKLMHINKIIARHGSQEQCALYKINLQKIIHNQKEQNNIFYRIILNHFQGQLLERRRKNY